MFIKLFFKIISMALVESRDIIIIVLGLIGSFLFTFFIPKISESNNLTYITLLILIIQNKSKPLPLGSGQFLQNCLLFCLPKSRQTMHFSAW